MPAEFSFSNIHLFFVTDAYSKENSERVSKTARPSLWGSDAVAAGERLFLRLLVGSASCPTSSLAASFYWTGKF
jgi:hypothetical protein